MMSASNVPVVDCHFDGTQPLFCFNSEIHMGQHICQKCFARSPLAVSEEKSAINWDYMMVDKKSIAELAVAAQG